MATKTASAFEGFETFTNSFKMIFKMHLCILAGCLLLQCFILYALWDFRSYDNRFMLGYQINFVIIQPDSVDQLDVRAQYPKIC